MPRKKTPEKTPAKKLLEWQDTVLMTSPVPYALCTSQEAFRDELKRLGMEDDEWLCKGADATTHILTGENGGQAVIVCIPSVPEDDTVDVYSTLCHEAVHVWQTIRKSIGEKRPGIEQEAYSIQNIARNLMMAYRKQTT